MKSSAAVVIVLTSVAAAQEPSPRARAALRVEHSMVGWGAPKAVDQGATLEIGDGDGHGFTLNWARFRPTPAGVEVLVVRLRGVHNQAVTARAATMPPATYAALLSDIAAVRAATVLPLQRSRVAFSSRDFWVSARLDGAAPLHLDWAGYEGSSGEADYAKPRAAVMLATAAVRNLPFRDQELTADVRAWVSAKAAREEKSASGATWWVAERTRRMRDLAGTPPD